MAALVTVRPGIYTATYGGTSLGITTSDGWKLKWRFSETKINNTNLYADTLIDGIFRGINAQLMVTLKEWNAVMQGAIYPWSNATPALDGVLGTIGQLASGVAKQIVLTADTASPAFLAPGKTLTALAKLAPENDMEMLFGPVETDMALLFDLLLYDDSGTKRIFKFT